MSNKNVVVRRSKHLSLVLRHNPDSVGITLDEAGWTEVSTLLPAMQLTMDDLEEVVRDNNKKRFEFSPDKKRIRASQGHSVEVDLGYEEKQPPEILYHGTSRNFLADIMREGLKPMERHDVHLTAKHDTAIDTGRRRPNPTVLIVQAGQMFRDGYKFRVSTNGVWLIWAVPAKYLSEEKPS